MPTTWKFDPNTNTYVSPSGKRVTPAQLREIQAQTEGNHKVELMALAVALLWWQQLNQVRSEADRLALADLLDLVPDPARVAVATRVKSLGAISSAEYQVRFADQIHKAHRVNAVLGAGGFQQMNIQTWNYAAQKAESERRFMSNMAGEMARDLVSPAQAVNRSAMYAEAPYSTFSTSQQMATQARGGKTIEARRILDPRAEHCEDCPTLASEEFAAIEDVAPIGQSACRSRCRCWIEYRKVEAGTQPEAPPTPDQNVPLPSPYVVVLVPGQANS